MYCDGRVLINRMAIFHKYYAFEHCMVWLYGSLFLHKSIFGVCSFGWIVFFTHAFCRWMTSYKLHLTDTIERMNKGQNIQGRMRGGGKSRGTPPPSNRSILKKPSIVSQACICKKKWLYENQVQVEVSGMCRIIVEIILPYYMKYSYFLSLIWFITILYLFKLLKTCIDKIFYFLFSFIWKNWKKYLLLRCIMFWIHVTEWYTSTCSGIFIFWGECLLKLHELKHLFSTTLINNSFSH